jgi:hypothetical protein
MDQKELSQKAKEFRKKVRNYNLRELLCELFSIEQDQKVDSAIGNQDKIALAIKKDYIIREHIVKIPRDDKLDYLSDLEKEIKECTNEEFYEHVDSLYREKNLLETYLRIRKN